MRRKAILAVVVLVGGVIFPVARNAGAADDPKPVQPAKILDQRLRGKSALAALKSKNLLPAVATAVGKSQAQIETILSTDESAVIDEAGSLFYVEPVFDAARAAEIAAEPKRVLSPDLAKADRPANLGPIPDVSTLAPPRQAPGTSGGSASKPGTNRPNPSSSPVATGGAPAPEAGPFPYSQTFLLNSRSGSTKTIYLDFDGYTVVNSVGSTQVSAWPTYAGPAWDTDGNPATFSAAEQDTIQSIWQRMAEDYAPFDVNVTTQFPGQTAITRADAADNVYGTTVAFVNGPSTIPCGGLAGGCAYLNKFGTFSPTHQWWQPAWVHASNLSDNAKFMAEAGSHEAGHNFGMSHDGCTTASPECGGGTAYYGGHANWAPIMGNGYNRPVTQWSSGEYALANNTENDTQIISSQTGYVPDDANVSLATASDLGTVNNQFSNVLSGSGLINGASPSGDVDFFRFYSPTAKTVTINANPAPNSPNLDIGLYLYDAAGTQLAFSNPTSGLTGYDSATGLGASITIDLPSYGYYYIRIWNEQTDGTGDAGYSFYGTQGTYSVSVVGGPPPGDGFWTVPVTRLLDTRPTPIASGATRNLTVTGVAGVPANATAVALNVAAVGPLGAGHLRVFPAGTPLPTASVLNFAVAKNTPNHVMVKVGAAGQISIYAGNTTNVIVDVSGFWIPDDDGNDQYQSVATPTRIHQMVLAPLSTVTVPVLGVGGIPTQAGLPGAGIIAVAVNVGAINPGATGHIRVFKAGAPLPTVSSNNFVAGDSRMNLVLAEPSSAGAIDIYNASTGTVTITVDTVGWFQWGGQAFKPITPIRPLDTRSPANVVTPGDFREVQVRGFGVVPNSTDVKAVVVNIAAVNPTASGSIDAGPSGANPALPSFTHPANENVANLAIVPVGADGKIRIRNNSSGTTHMIVDITGYFTD
jgi:hypothetical protein